MTSMMLSARSLTWTIAITAPLVIGILAFWMIDISFSAQTIQGSTVSLFGQRQPIESYHISLILALDSMIWLEALIIYMLAKEKESAPATERRYIEERYYLNE